MHFTALDYCAFIGYILVVVTFAMYMSRREKSSEDYFLAGRKLTWWLIGISLIASNISTEHFVGMAGAGYETGLAIASYEWTAAIAIVLVAIFLLPKFLKRGIYTIPEYLEHRYSSGARGLMAFYMMAAYIFVIISAVLYAGAIGLDAVFGDAVREFVANSSLKDTLPNTLGEQWLMILSVWMIGIIAGLYTVWGGLKAVVWADLFNGLGLILSGILVTILGFLAVSSTFGEGTGLVEGMGIFIQRAGDKLSTVKPWDHPTVPWIAVFIGGLWIPQFFYWGLNQFITQRALGAKSVAEGQKGMVFAAGLKLLMPFIIIFPGIMAFELYADQIADKDKAYPHMIQMILPAGLRGLMLAALFGAVMSSLDSMLNSASTIFTMDLYKRYLNRQASDRSLIRLGRMMTAVFVILACFWAPQLAWIAGGHGVFDYIQMTWGFITPGIVAVFFFGLCFKRTPSQAAIAAMLLGPPFYMWCLKVMPDVAFLHHMAFTFIALCIYMFVITMLTPLRDVVASSASGEDKAELPAGALGHTLIPYITATLGGYMLAVALFQFSFVTAWQITDYWGWGRPAEWIHFVVAGVPTLIYVFAALAVMRLPSRTTRRVMDAAQSRARRSVLRPIMIGAAGLAGPVIVGLHVYIFCLCVLPANQPDKYWQKAYEVDISAIGAGQLVITEKVMEDPLALPPEELLGEGEGEVGNALPESDGEGMGAMEGGPGESDQAAGDEGPNAEEGEEEGAEAAVDDWAEIAPVVVEEPKDKIIDVYLTPLIIGVASALAFLVGLVMLCRLPTGADVEVPTAVSFDLRPSRMVKVWGFLVIVGAVALYYLFF